MQTAQPGVDLIKHFEGFRPDAYQDSVGIWTIGYGHTKGVKQGDKITEAEGEELLREDLADAESAVNRLVTTYLCQHQFDALVSFTFNLGAGNLQSSTLLRKLNAGDYAGAAPQFDRWVNAGGKRLAGLVRRRAAERALFEGK